MYIICVAQNIVNTGVGYTLWGKGRFVGSVRFIGDNAIRRDASPSQVTPQGPVVRKAINANPGLKINPGLISLVQKCEITRSQNFGGEKNKQKTTLKSLRN